MTSMGARQSRLPAASGKRTIALPAAPISCRIAREFVLSVTGGPEDPRVALVVSELVANAVVHAHTGPQLRVGWDGRTVDVEVEDDGPGRPVLRAPGPLTASGRGLALVDRIADAWGVASPPESDADHPKVVWARIRLAD
ncbi:MAG: ATP-binding protein [Acidimicrobiaceae bacterium]|nr:ATP-binding protein [Acidimicrobiaceae bacterium]